EIGSANCIHAAASADAADGTPNGTANFLIAAADARISATEAYDTAARDCVQIHGGIGVTWEQGSHSHMRRARSSAIEQGNSLGMSDYEAFRARARTWSQSVVGEFGREARRGSDVEQDSASGRRYSAARFDAGFAGINWPTEMGGQGSTHIEKVIFDTEEMGFGMPTAYFGISSGMPVPISMRCCEDKAVGKERVRRASGGEETWCQVFAERAGGSDSGGSR
ncbi:hypothetical protein OY671_008975, partial [Metschnikowia pulcherrima]